MHTIKIQQLWFFEAPQRTIYKYELEQGGETEISDFFDEILDVQIQRGKMIVWASVAPVRKNAKGEITERRESEKTTLIFTALGTGWMYKKYVGEYFRTVQAPDGLVWHIFVREKENG
jgi:hypothetical protein